MTDKKPRSKHFGTTDAATSTTLRSLLSALERIAPKRLAEPWDNVGLLVGHADAPLTAVGCCLDLTENVVDEALKRGANAIVCHHPVIFHKLSCLRTDEPLGHLLSLCLKHDLAILAAHTNLDAAQGGLNDELARLLGITVQKPLIPREGEPGCGLGRVGEIAPCPARDFLNHAATVLKLREGRLIGDEQRLVRKLAWCSGAGADFIPQAAREGVDLYLTGDVKYHDAMLARDLGLCVADLSHFGTEWPVADLLARRIQQEFSKKSNSLPVFAISTEADPARGIIFQALLDNLEKA